MSISLTTAPHSRVVAWHDCECGGYGADLELWRGLAGEARGPVLELGAGTGRVALDLARAGIDVTAADRDPELLAELDRRASARGLEVVTRLADVRELDLDGRFALIAATMQLAHLMAGEGGRRAMLRSAAAHVAPGGILAVALLADAEPPSSDERPPPLPDVLERDGWTYSSLPLELRRDGDALELRRLRQSVSPSGKLSEEINTARLDLVSPEQLESEASAAGLRPAGRLEIPPTQEHVGSTVVLVEAE